MSGSKLIKRQVHKFKDSVAMEQYHARRLDLWMGESYKFRPATMQEQWRGIDRVAADDYGEEVTIDYKCCGRAHKTGNAFIETVSNDRTGRLGWAETMEADWLFYYVSGDDTVYACLVSTIREKLPEWKRCYREVPVRNAEYNTLGLLIPLRVLEDVAEYVAHVDTDCCVLLPRDAEEEVADAEQAEESSLKQLLKGIGQAKALLPF